MTKFSRKSLLILSIIMIVGVVVSLVLVDWKSVIAGENLIYELRLTVVFVGLFIYNYVPYRKGVKASVDQS